MELEIREDDKHKVVDLKKLKMYSPYFIEMCDELFEIDAVGLTIRTIFYRKDKYSEITEETDIFSVISRFVYPDDIQKVEAVFSERGLTQIVEENQIVKIEFRTKTRFDTYTWVEGKALYVKTGNVKKILFITYDIESKKQMSLLAKEKNAILDAFINLYKAILEVDLHSEKVQVLKTIDDKTQLCEDNTFLLADLLPKMIERLGIESERQELLEFFEIKHLKEMAALKKEQSLDLRFEKENKQFEWIQINILYLPGREDKIYVVFGNSDKEHVLNSIAEKFVYKNSDWFYYLDLKNDYFIRYSGNADEHTLPPEEGWDYRNAMIEYSKECVVSEDQDWVIACMEPEYMINRLDKEDGEYQISFGVSDDMGGYRRKEIVCRYYDEENKIVLVQRNDITEDYDYKKSQEEKLALVEREAQEDALTGTYNRTGGQRLIEEYLRQNQHTQNAFLIIDLDNFKKVNDCMGHLQGDEVLKKCSLLMKETLRPSDIIVRIGGDEFVAFLKDIKSREEIIRYTERLVEELQMPYIFENRALFVSGSIGIAVTPDNGNTFEELYEKADRALYTVKTEGKNNFSFYEKS